MCAIHRVLLAAVCGSVLYGQLTQVDLRMQSRNVDFSGASATKPFRSASGFPAACSVGEMFYKLDAPPGANLYACTSQNSWTLEQTSMANQLGDFAVARTGATTLAIGANCSSATPCTARVGASVYSFSSGGSVSLAAGTGLALIYISSTGVLTVGHNLAASCTAGCVAQSGVIAFPADAIPLYTWTATSGTWDAAGGVDQRAFLSARSVTAGTGLISAEVSGDTQLSADPSVIGLRVAAPAASSSTCTTGSWAMDGSYFYVCISSNTWRRAALATF